LIKKLGASLPKISKSNKSKELLNVRSGGIRAAKRPEMGSKSERLQRAYAAGSPFDAVIKLDRG
jgi:hypothetical protein